MRTSCGSAAPEQVREFRMPDWTKKNFDDLRDDAERFEDFWD